MEIAARNKNPKGLSGLESEQNCTQNLVWTLFSLLKINAPVQLQQVRVGHQPKTAKALGIEIRPTVLARS
jgi:hypothetical protein